MNLRRPTVMPSGQLRTDAAKHPPTGKPLPTRLPLAAPPADATPLQTSPTSPVSQISPRRLDGVTRHGLQISLERIRSRFPALGADAALQIQQVLQATVPETLTRRQAADWGLALQRRYGEVVEKTLQLKQHPQRLAAQQHLQRLFVLLQEVFEALEHQLQPGLLTRWRASPWQVLTRHQPEIDTLRHALAGAADFLAGQLEALQAQQKELTQLTGQLLTHALAASLLAENLPASHDVTAVLLQRAAELQQMHSHVGDAMSLRDQGVADLSALNTSLHHAVLLLLPAWLDRALHSSRNTNINNNPTVMLQQQQDLDLLLRAIRTT